MYIFFQKIIQFRYLLILCLIICGFYYNLFVDRATIELEIIVDHPTYFKLYWAEKGEPYIERESIYIRVKNGKEKYEFLPVDMEDVERLRIDPI